jgi:hypothetical protein
MPMLDKLLAGLLMAAVLGTGAIGWVAVSTGTAEAAGTACQINPARCLTPPKKPRR